MLAVNPQPLDTGVTTIKRLSMAFSLALLLVCGSLVVAGTEAGPGKDTFTLKNFASASYKETFKGGELAVVTLTGNGATDLDIYVYDLKGNLVVKGDGPTD